MVSLKPKVATKADQPKIPVNPDMLQGLAQIKSDDAISDLLTGLMNEDSLNIKSELKRPICATRLMVMAQRFRDLTCPKTADSIELFVEKHLGYMVSKDRKGRVEMVTAVADAIAIKFKTDQGQPRSPGDKI